LRTDLRNFISSKFIEALKLPRRHFLRMAAGAAFPVTSRIATAQAHPNRPITIIAPFPAGGPTDAIARIMAEWTQVSLGRTIIVERVGGANESTGTGRVARAAPDEYTLGFGVWNTHLANAAIYALRYDVQKRFRAGGIARKLIAVDSREEDSAGEPFAGIDFLAKD
jgi:hypothetical protein